MQDLPNVTAKVWFLILSKDFCIQGTVAVRVRSPFSGACRDSVASQPNRTQMTRALLRLRELILNGEFAPGERMSELPLVERLGVSRSPLRLALASLEHEGLLRGLEGGGYAVREFTKTDIRDAIELRGVLEGTAARFAAERGVTRRDLSALWALNDGIAPLVGPRRLRLVRALRRDQRALPREDPGDRAQPDARARARGDPVAPVRRRQRIRDDRGRAARVPGDAGRRLPPSPGHGRRDRGPPERPRRGARPRARPCRAEEPRDRAPAIARCSSGCPGRR